MKEFFTSGVGIFLEIVSAVIVLFLYYLAYCKFFDEAGIDRKKLRTPIFNVLTKCKIIQKTKLFTIYAIFSAAAMLFLLVHFSCYGARGYYYKIRSSTSVSTIYYGSLVLTAICLCVREVINFIVRMHMAKAFGQKTPIQILCGFLPIIFIPYTAISFNYLREKSLIKQHQNFEAAYTRPPSNKTLS